MITDRFDEAHEQQYRHSAPEEPKEIVTVQLTAKGMIESPDLPGVDVGDESVLESAVIDERDVYFEDTGFVDTEIIDRAELQANNELSGPAIIEETTSTTVLPPSFEASVNEFGHIIVDTGGESNE